MVGTHGVGAMLTGLPPELGAKVGARAPVLAVECVALWPVDDETPEERAERRRREGLLPETPESVAARRAPAASLLLPEGLDPSAHDGVFVAVDRAVVFLLEGSVVVARHREVRRVFGREVAPRHAFVARLPADSASVVSFVPLMDEPGEYFALVSNEGARVFRAHTPGDRADLAQGLCALRAAAAEGGEAGGKGRPPRQSGRAGRSSG